jgi:chemotaxis protein CheX
MSIDHEFLIKTVRESTEEVFSTMLSIELEPGESFTTQSPNAAGGDGVLAFVGLAGKWVGTGSVSVSSALACRISSQFLMTEYKSIDEDVLDALAEVTNMIIGNVKTRLEEILGPMGLSIPTVIHGRNFTSRTLGTQEWTGILFNLDGERMEIQVCLAPHQDSSRSKPSFAVHSLVTR